MAFKALIWNPDDKKIVRNIGLLYVRMIVSTIVSLITARYTLRLLGIEDYGIYNIVGNIVGFMQLITGSMISASQRFLAYDLGKNDRTQYQYTFSMLVNVFAIFCLFVLIIMEVLGPYCIKNYLVIPQDRLVAAIWAFRFSVFTFIMKTIIIPYSSSIIAHEKMDIYAYFTLVDVAFNLIIVFVLYTVDINRLIALSALILLMNILLDGLIFWYCVKKIDGCIYKPGWESHLFKKIFSYSGWNLIGSTTAVLNQQGLAVLLNIFFGPVVNAAKAIADRINYIILSFCSNFYMAVSPQIVKTYAAGENERTKTLVLESSKLAFFLMLLLSVPLIFNMEEILRSWFGKDMVSDDMIYFSQLMLVFTTINTLEYPITQVIRATGNVKKYQIQVGVQILTFIPLTYIMFMYGFPPYSSMITLSAICFIAQLTRVKIMGKVIDVSMSEYVRIILKPIAIVSVLSTVILHFTTIRICTNIHISILNFLQAFIITGLVIYLFGLSSIEKLYIKQTIIRKLLHKA